MPNRNINFPETNVVRLQGHEPRFGAAYDLFGNGRTAIKGNFGRYSIAVDPSQGNPVGTQLVNRVTRSWNPTVPTGTHAGLHSPVRPA